MLNLATGKYTVTLIPGDGIGKEVADSVKEIFEGLKVPVQWEQYDVSGETPGGDELFQQAMESLKRNKVGLKGPINDFPMIEFKGLTQRANRHLVHADRPDRT